MSLKIPDRDREPLRKWLLGDSEDATKLFDALPKMQPALHLLQFVRALAKHTELPLNELGPGVAVLMNLSETVLGAKKEEQAEILDDVFRTLTDTAPDEVARTRFDARVQAVLESLSVQITRKALDVQLDNQATFDSARTLSEVRPIFSEADDICAFVVVHQLKLSYWTSDSDEERELFLALDLKDLNELKTVIERAISKHAKIQTVLAQGRSIPLLEDEP